MNNSQLCPHFLPVCTLGGNRRNQFRDEVVALFRRCCIPSFGQKIVLAPQVLPRNILVGVFSLRRDPPEMIMLLRRFDRLTAPLIFWNSIFHVFSFLFECLFSNVGAFSSSAPGSYICKLCPLWKESGVLWCFLTRADTTLASFFMIHYFLLHFFSVVLFNKISPPPIPSLFPAMTEYLNKTFFFFDGWTNMYNIVFSVLVDLC